MEFKDIIKAPFIGVINAVKYTGETGLVIAKIATVGAVAATPAACNNIDFFKGGDNKISAEKIKEHARNYDWTPRNVSREVVKGWTDVVGGGLSAVRDSFPDFKSSSSTGQVTSPATGVVVPKIEYVGNTKFETIKSWETYKVLPPRKKVTDSSGVREFSQSEVIFNVKVRSERAGWHEVNGKMNNADVTKWIQLDQKGNMIGFSNNAK